MNKTIYIVISIFVIGFFAFEVKKTILPSSSISQPTVKIKSKIIKVEIADEFKEQIQGLSDRKNLCPECGMLFIFNNKQERTFWMKNMNFPIDIIWLNDKIITNISHNLPPEGDKPENLYKSSSNVNYVLEVNSGFSEKNNIKTGDRVIFNF